MVLARVADAALRRDVEAGSDQSHAAAEAGQLHANPLLPKLRKKDAIMFSSCIYNFQLNGSSVNGTTARLALKRLAGPSLLLWTSPLASAQLRRMKEKEAIGEGWKRGEE
ncbi:hypothetical protein GRJ2_000675800 [Grus japonensis]|uniref:Uncharacterized protein n=1 Tax=Grus japonensis TaxID=30415 RepID=A0ABC9W9W4_GRUJA